MEPQACTKCHQLPEDILMLACSHDLCLNCASDRLAFEMKKKKIANSIVCQFCYERTPLDAESVAELQKIIHQKVPAISQEPIHKNDAKTVQRSKYSYDHGVQKNDRDIKFEKPYQRTKQKSYERTNPKESSLSYGVGLGNKIDIPAAKKSCNQHPEEQILYFCFDCKCQCICPQCVIHGKHKDHNVKTIKKSHPVIKSELQSVVQKLQNNVEGLLIKKSQIEKNIRTLNQQANLSKRHIQSAFEEIRNKLQAKQKEVMKTCDVTLAQGTQQLDKYAKNIIKRIDEIKLQTTTSQQYLRRDEMTALNYYAKKWKHLNQQCKDTDIETKVINFPSNQLILASILDIGDQINKIGMGDSRKKY